MRMDGRTVGAADVHQHAAPLYQLYQQQQQQHQHHQQKLQHNAISNDQAADD